MLADPEPRWCPDGGEALPQEDPSARSARTSRSSQAKQQRNGVSTKAEKKLKNPKVTGSPGGPSGPSGPSGPADTGDKNLNPPVHHNPHAEQIDRLETHHQVQQSHYFEHLVS